MTPSADLNSVENGVSGANDAPASYKSTASGENAAPNSDGTKSSVKTLSAFFDLPRELQVRIVELSCRAYKKALRCSSTLGFDDATAIELLCTSKYFKALVTPIFYSHVRVSRPSSLLNLFNTISAHPERGRMIRSLHLGPDEEIFASHWPLSYFDDDVHIRSSLTSYFCSSFRDTRVSDAHLEPEWHCDIWDVSLTTAEPHCRGKAIYRALKAARRALDVDPLSPGRDKHDNNIGLASWCVRIFQLRAVLDLYLIAMRSLDDDRGHDLEHWEEETMPVADACEEGNCVHRYPRLNLDNISTLTDPEVDSKVLRLTSLQISQHLARPHKVAMTDHFHHPLLFARSGYPFPDADMNIHSQLAIGDLLKGGPDDPSQPVIIHDDDEAGAEAGEGAQGGASRATQHLNSPDTGHAREYLRQASRRVDAKDETIPSAETVGGLLAMARILLLLAPKVENLSLTGIFHQLLCGRNPIALPSLRCLTIGPVLPYWKATFTSRGMSKLPNLEKLRLCVSTLSNDEVDALTGMTGDLGKLKILRWETMPSLEAPTVRLCSISRLAKLIHRLQASVQGRTAPLSTSIALGKRRRDSSGDGTGSSSAHRSAHDHSADEGEAAAARSVPIIEVVMEVVVLDQLLSEDSSLGSLLQEQKGGSPSAASDPPPSIRLVKSRAPESSTEAPKYSVTEKMYEESRRWWEECAVFCGFGG